MTQELCNLCGLCKANCPIYKATRKETYSPRGQIILVRENILTEKINKCLNCDLCKEACPSAIDVSKIVRNARALMRNSSQETEEDKVLIQKLRETGNIYGV